MQSKTPKRSPNSSTVARTSPAVRSAEVMTSSDLRHSSLGTLVLEAMCTGGVD